MSRPSCLRRFPLLPAVLLAAGLAAFATAGTAGADDPAAAAAEPRIRVHFNQHFIEGLYAPLDLDDPVAVLDLVFPQLDDRVVVYTTENYYYFSFQAAGRTVWGNLRLDARERDDGVLYLGYFTYYEDGRFQDRTGRVKAFTAEDGARVEKLGDFDYAVSWRGRTVHFRLNELVAAPPRRAELRPEETFVGPVFDESGLRFALVFDRTARHFLYLLDEDRPVPETFRELADGVVVGERTGFAFYDDRPLGRKVLVAVSARNAERNSYYDGPFDQLPDNFVEQTRIRSYIEQAYPNTRGALDRFGGFARHKGVRMAITPYYVYSTDDDLAFVRSCLESGLEEPEAYRCITPDFQELYACSGAPGESCVLPEPGVTGEAVLELEVSAVPGAGTTADPATAESAAPGPG